MKKKLGVFVSSMFMIQVLGAGVVGAAYNSSGDIALNVNTGTSVPVSGSTGQTTFQTQEAAHQTVTNTTGTSVDHSYIWVNVNGTSVLAIDPPCTMFN